METRIDYENIANKGISLMLMMDTYINKVTTLEERILFLVSRRVSQINLTENCFDLQKPKTIYLVDDDAIENYYKFEYSHLFTEREKIALNFSELLTSISNHRISDCFFDAMKSAFTQNEILDLIFFVNQTNSWNRLTITMAKHQ